MKRIILAVLFSVLVMGNGVADVVGTVAGSSQDANGNIIVWVSYAVDGVDVPSPRNRDGVLEYPVINGRETLGFRTSFQNIDGMTQEQVGEWIDKNVEDHCKNLLTRKATAIENAKLDLTPYVGREVTVSSADIQVSETKAFTVSTAGKVSEKVLTPMVEVISK